MIKTDEEISRCRKKVIMDEKAVKVINPVLVKNGIIEFLYGKSVFM
jgi:hypothetical protein